MLVYKGIARGRRDARARGGRVHRARMCAGGGCARRPDGPTRARTRVARDGFESASTHEAVELPAGVAALHTALAKVDRDNLTHFVIVWLTLTLNWVRQLPDKSRFGVLANSCFISKPPTKRPNATREFLSSPQPPIGDSGLLPNRVFHTWCTSHFILFHMSQHARGPSCILHSRISSCSMASKASLSVSSLLVRRYSAGIALRDALEISRNRRACRLSERRAARRRVAPACPA